MNVYSVSPDYAYGVLNQVGEYVDRERWRKAAGNPNLAGWQAPTLRLTPQSRLIPLDCIMSSSPPGRGMLLNARACLALAPLLLSCGEYLSVHVGDLDYRWFNCTTMIDIAVQDKIEGEKFQSSIVSPGWRTITRWAFHHDLVAQAPPIFAVPQESRTALLCTDLLKQAVEEHELLGFKFEHLWSSEGGGIDLEAEVFFGPEGKERGERVKQRRKMMAARLAERIKAEARVETGAGRAKPIRLGPLPQNNPRVPAVKRKKLTYGGPLVERLRDLSGPTLASAGVLANATECAVMLHAGAGATGRSHLGGRPCGQARPTRIDGAPLSLLAEIFLDEVPEFADRAALPPTGLLQVWFDAVGMPRDTADGGRILFYPDVSEIGPASLAVSVC